jgi:hypothetical protein
MSIARVHIIIIISWVKPFYDVAGLISFMLHTYTSPG